MMVSIYLLELILPAQTIVYFKRLNGNVFAVTLLVVKGLGRCGTPKSTQRSGTTPTNIVGVL